MQFGQVKRREFITVLAGTAAWPLAARAQSGPVRRIGVLMNGAATEARPQSYVAALIEGLRQLGWQEGHNVRIDLRWNPGTADRPAAGRDRGRCHHEPDGHPAGHQQRPGGLYPGFRSDHTGFRC
jgi:hypothetical protein